MRIFKGMDENQFWLSVWTVIVTGVVLIITVLVWSSAKNDIVLTNLLESGHDPMELTCLFNAGSKSMEIPCLLIAQEKAKTYATK